ATVTGMGDAPARRPRDRYLGAAGYQYLECAVLVVGVVRYLKETGLLAFAVIQQHHHEGIREGVAKRDLRLDRRESACIAAAKLAQVAIRAIDGAVIGAVGSHRD